MLEVLEFVAHALVSPAMEELALAMTIGATETSVGYPRVASVGVWLFPNEAATNLTLRRGRSLCGVIFMSIWWMRLFLRPI